MVKGTTRQVLVVRPQEQLDGALREIFGEATVPFAVRHPYIREIDYTKERR